MSLVHSATPTVAVLTGAAGGIGTAVAAGLLDDGWTVVAVDSAADALTALAERLPVHPRPVDVTDPAAVADLIDAVETGIGPIGLLVNAAGTLRTGLATDLDPVDWAAMFAVNRTAVCTVSTAVARRMVPPGTGVIVTVSSNAAGVPRQGMAAYAASKAAATMFTKSLGLELAAHGIRCNVVAPGSTDTPMLRGMWPAGEPESESVRHLVGGNPEAYTVGIPLRKLAVPEDIAHAVRFLASSRASHIALQELYVDGGATLGV